MDIFEIHKNWNCNPQKSLPTYRVQHKVTLDLRFKHEVHKNTYGSQILLQLCNPIESNSMY
jgi:hypothetical protein